MFKRMLRVNHKWRQSQFLTFISVSYNTYLMSSQNLLVPTQRAKGFMKQIIQLFNETWLFSSVFESFLNQNIMKTIWKMIWREVNVKGDRRWGIVFTINGSVIHLIPLTPSCLKTKNWSKSNLIIEKININFFVKGASINDTTM